MKLNVDSLSIEVPCPNCGNKVAQTLGQLQAEPDRTCAVCGQRLFVNQDQLRASVDEAEKVLVEFARTLGSKRK